ncbi:MAG TPA: TetR/AcrR family transcriptional regulator [Gaiellaceae bacterium]|jgi:TetR/AcrR family fatty acid metabolism transcriptional regulator|nr:TetR/AcrR family transcriptional regulator [Gaiellaceae bacterium]
MSVAEGKQAQILQAAARVFAAQGYEATRVGDIATEAGVAYGLVYHYFGSKEAVLDAVFREAWGRLLAAVAQAEQTGETAPEQLELVVKIVLRTWRDDPDLVRLLVREVTRSPHIQDELDEIGQAFATIQRIIERGQSEGTLRADVDARLAAWMLYGALEEVLTGWVLGQLEEDVAAAEREVTATFVGGLRPRTD